MKRSLLLLVGCLMAVVCAMAQDNQSQVRVLTFEEAVKIALQNSVLLNQQKNNLEFSQMQKMAAYVGAGPSINAQSQIFRSNGNRFNANQGEVVNGTFDGASASATANLTLFSGFSQLNTIRQFTKALEAQSYFVNRTAQDAINTVATQYLTVMRDVELLIIAQKNFAALDKQLEQVKEMVSLGSRSPVDEYNQDALTKAAELRMVQAEITLNNDKTLLQQTLLLDPFEEFTVEAPNWDVNAMSSETLNIEELADRAKGFRGDYLRSVRSEEALRFATKAARGGYFPSIGASASLSTAWNFTHGVDPASDDYPRPFRTQFLEDNVQKSIGVGINIPILNGFQQRQFVTQTRINYENQKITTRNLEFQIKNDVIRTVRNFEGAKKAFAVTTRQLEAADLAYQFETERYALGVTNFVEFTNANRVLVQAQTDKASAEYTLVFQKILLEYAVGTLKPEDVAATTNK
ncbi:MAG TPA: TolC family protein [Cyclobacteriaceae bacterium]|nr:TolC family protein [Cyclobacteriaceae bacterium]